jgi:hypothetical protein
MSVSDQKVIEFFWKSPIKSFATMLDVFRYFEHGQIFRADIEHELFDGGLGDNPRREVSIRVPELRGIPISAHSLFLLTQHLKEFRLVKRRPHKTRGPHADPDDQLVVCYDLTPTGKSMLQILAGIERARGNKRKRSRK